MEKYLVMIDLPNLPYSGMIPLSLILMEILQCVFTIPFAWQAIVIICGHFRKEKEPEGDIGKKNRFAVLICAKDEERVVGTLLDSLSKQAYPREYVQIYLFADHCSDNTAQVGRKHGNIRVYERNTGLTRGKGDVLAWGIDRVLREHGDEIDAFVFFDADNVADKDFLSQMNRRLNSGENVIQGNRLAGKPFRTIVTKGFAIYWMLYDFGLLYQRQKLGLSSFVTGTGFVAKKTVLSEGWKTKTITEDVEFAIQCCLKGERVAYCHKAAFFDEQPSQFSVMVKQLSRWCTGNYQILAAYMNRLFFWFKGEKKLMRLDNLMLLLVGPANCAMAITMVITTFMIAREAPMLVALAGAMVYLAQTLISIFVLTFFYKADMRTFFPACFFMPVFFGVFGICSIIGLICPKRRWEKIEHEGISEALEEKV